MKKLFLSAVLFLCSSVFANTLEFVVTASAGGPNDTVTRKLAEQIERETDLKIVVVNRPGAAHMIGYSYVQSSNKPTLVLSTPEVLLHPVHKEVHDLYFLGNFYNAVFVSEKSGIKNLQDLRALSTVRFGHGGVNTFSHQAMLQLCQTLNCLDVPFKSGAEGMLGLLSDTIDAYAVVSYGSKQYSGNPRYRAVHRVTAAKGQQWWLRVFGKNVAPADLEKIKAALDKLTPEFYSDIGLLR